MDHSTQEKTDPSAILPRLCSGPVAIPHTSSRSAVSGKVSFLDLSAEIRNAIDEMALVLPGPLFIAANGELHRCIDDRNSDLVTKRAEFEVAQRRKQEMDEWRFHRSHVPFLRAYHPSCRIFATSRQVYHEASSVFYAQNHANHWPSCKRVNEQERSTALTEIVRYLRRDDLAIKRHLHAICHIAVKAHGQTGTILFRSTHKLPCYVSLVYGNVMFVDIRLKSIAPIGVSWCLEDIRINVAPLIRHAAYLGDCRNPVQIQLRIVCWQGYADGSEKVVWKAAAPLRKLQIFAAKSYRRLYKVEGERGRGEGLDVDVVIVDGNGGLSSLTRSTQRDTTCDPFHDGSSNDPLSSPPESPPSPPSASFKGRLSKFEFKENVQANAQDCPPKSSSTTASTLPIKRPRPPTSATSASPQPKKQKRKPSKYAPPSKYAHLTPLTDILAPNLICVFVGTNPGIGTALAGHAYAHPSNLFWKLLHSSGLTDRRLKPEEDRSLPALYCMGNTNIVERPSKDAAELSKEEMAAGTEKLEEKFRKFRPEAVCIVGKGIWEAIWRYRLGRGMRKEEFKYGWQDGEQNMGKCDEWEGARVFVTTSTSGLAASLKPAEKEAIWKPFGEWVRKRREDRGFVPQVISSDGKEENVLET
ncbi:hypothetical protein T440DRAFT_476797 [Plenodomus tracheiphilus IPT5]|uniref:Uracil-DNA glycosylase-like domain-containing protein n=1 Tax=Plenodomus tracheiphilus IPT5 TaxID=1408161 RepID=A0A6A7BDT7_9PLEO|nr:hypothetical protein T440DRAFT_476797 [Plenodomus tracheiphilus IPT5]